MLASAPVLAPLLAAAAVVCAAVQDEGPGAPAPPAPPSIEEGARAEAPPRRWFLLPVVFWLPETKAGVGVAAGRDFQVDGSRRASNAFVVAAYSIERQGSLDGAADVYLRGGSLLSTRVRAVLYPDLYYGIGPATRSAGPEPFTRRFLEATVSAELAALDGRLRAGPRLAGRTEEVLDLVPGGRIETSGLPGVHGFDGLGVGGSVTWDDRDHPLWPSRGAFAQAYYVRYPAALGRNDGFGKGAVDLRAFQPVGGGRVLGVSGVVETTDGATPFTLLSKLGSARFLRGYREGRFRDRVVWAAQAELRAPVYGPLAATLFGAAGDVAPDLTAIRLEHLKVAGGAGARWRLTPGGANLRVDLAVGSGGPEVYVVLLEAF